ncbi:MAG: hypothetical protein KF696_13040 [Planctomycetes bacterium]|nr:hypothetical protein [Planctomycetota bacterium]MCW8135482.1 hypothetical protein [Planctomycetota bacterium]
MSSRVASSPLLPGLALAAVPASVAAILFVLACGVPGVTTDGFAYLDTAKHVAAGHGAYYAVPEGNLRPLITWPPLFPLLLAPGEWLGVDLLAWCRWLHALLFGLLAGGALLLVRAGGGGLRGGLLAAALISLTGNMPELFAMVYSEPLFLVLELAWLYMLWRACRSSGYRDVIIAGALAAALVLTRYAGAAFVLGGVVALCLSRRPSRVWRAAAYAGVAVLPVALWLLRNSLAGGSAVERPIEPLPFDADWLINVWRLATLWLLPAEASRWVRHLLLALLAMGGIAGLLVLWPRRLSVPGARRCLGFCGLCVLAAGCYIAFLAAATFASPREPTLDLRMLAPAQLPLMLALARAMAGLAGKGYALAVWGAALLLVGTGAWRAANFAQDANERGSEFTSVAWRESALLEAARGLPQGAVLASNQAEAVYWHLGQPCQPLPTAAEQGRDQSRLDPERVAKLRQAHEGRECFVLLFDQTWPWHAPAEVNERDLRLTPVARYSDGTLYRLGD